MTLLRLVLSFILFGVIASQDSGTELPAMGLGSGLRVLDLADTDAEFEFDVDDREEEEDFEEEEPLDVEERSGEFNNCDGKKDGAKCKKKCSGASCDAARCVESKCLTGRKYWRKKLKTLKEKQSKSWAKRTVNNCKGKKNGESCTKKCASPTCKEAKCCKEVCLTGNKYKTIVGMKNVC